MINKEIKILNEIKLYQLAIVHIQKEQKIQNEKIIKLLTEIKNANIERN